MTAGSVVLVERGAHISQEARSYRGPALIFPLGAGVVTMEAPGGAGLRIDRASYALAPENSRFVLRARSPLVEVATWILGTRAFADVAREYRGDVELSRITRLVSAPRILPRTRWIDEIVHRYVFERRVCEKPASQAARFLETEIAKELYFACIERDENKTRASIEGGENDTVRSARAFIDERLSSPLRIGDLARHCGTSESGLLRAFQKELGVTPAAFARARKMEAAHVLLDSKKLTVSEVASRVGYGNLAAFTTAFRKHFGTTPSSVSRANRELERLPPHGKPPRVRRKRRKV